MNELNNKIAPIGGEHRSAASMLAEIMNDPVGLTSCVVVTIREDGTSAFAHFNMSRAEMAFASLVIQRKALGPGDE